MTDSFKLSLNPRLSAPPPCDIADPRPTTPHSKAWPLHHWQPIDLWPNPSLPSPLLAMKGRGTTADTHPPLLPPPPLYALTYTICFLKCTTTTCHVVDLSAYLMETRAQQFGISNCFFCWCVFHQHITENGDHAASSSNATLRTLFFNVNCVDPTHIWVCLRRFLSTALTLFFSSSRGMLNNHKSNAFIF